MNEVKLSKFLSLILRHKPEKVGITLDDFGWADVNDLLAGMNSKGSEIDKRTLVSIVSNDSKNRYTFNNDGSKIRASQGHSIPVDMGLTPSTPPVYLYHGTNSRFLPLIKKDGLKSMSRNMVHLSDSVITALEVGNRRLKQDTYTHIFVIDTKTMMDDGIDFYVSENGVWLAEYIDPKYLIF